MRWAMLGWVAAAAGIGMVGVGRTGDARGEDAIGNAAATQPAAGATGHDAPRVSAEQLVDELLSLPTYVPDPRVQEDDLRTPLLREISARGEEAAGIMVARLLAMPDGAADPQGTKNAFRWQLIRDIGSLGNPAIKPLQAALGPAQTPLQRMEVTQTLGAVHTAAATAVILPLVSDRDDAVRREAIMALLGRLNAPLDQGGGEEVLGALIKMAPGEKSERFRSYICLGMRSVLDAVPPAAKPEERRVTLATNMLLDRLKNDPSVYIRTTAACVLTEFGDNSGLAEIEKAILVLEARGKPDDFGLNSLIRALERATGENFGPVPMHPMLSSRSDTSGLTAGREAVLKKVAAWIKAHLVAAGTQASREAGK